MNDKKERSIAKALSSVGALIKKIRRDRDVIYGNKDLEHLYTFKDFPVFMGCTKDQECKNDLLSDLCCHISKKSGLIQLNPLLPSSVIYQSEHGSGTVGKSWKDHHAAFAEFVCRSRIGKVLEIGGGHGILAQEVQQINGDLDWTIIEPNPIVIPDSNVEVIRGFFDEKFNSKEKYNTVVHSHVLEHAYDPNAFVGHISSLISDGQLIFSIPNMDVMIEEGYGNCVNFEHTFLLGEPFVEYLLSKHGFRIVEKEYYKEDHSIFYLAVKDDSVPLFQIPPSTYHKYTRLYKEYIRSHISDVAEINNAIKNFDGSVYLFGAHVFSQLLISFGLDTTNIVSILDNDSSKSGKRLYGTQLLSHAPQILEDCPNPLVILRCGAYNEEVKEDILTNINDRVKFI